MKELASSEQTLLYMTVGAFALGLVLLALFEAIRRKSARKLLETVSELRSVQLAERLERLEAERERAENDQLRNLDRMKDEFVALVSHELRNRSPRFAATSSSCWTTPSSCRARALAAQCVQAARPAAEDAGVELVFSSESSEPIVGDPARIAQLLDTGIDQRRKR